jgi:GDPmannose 4,6-dehydratase
VKFLITGIFGQDGSYLAERLDRDGHDVTGLVHRHGDPRQHRMRNLLAPRAQFVEGDLTDTGSLIRAVEHADPDVIFHLGAVSAPAAGWISPEVMFSVTALGTVRLLEAVREANPGAEPTVVVAGSIATHGPYGAAKTFSRAIAADYRARGMRVSTAVFGGHHSPRRAPHFFARKVTLAAASIRHQLDAGDVPAKLLLGPLDRAQDWMDARDAVAALVAIAGLDEPDDYVVSTNHPHTCESWVREAFAAVDLDWREWVRAGERDLAQPTDVPTLSAWSTLPGWHPATGFTELVKWMVEADKERMIYGDGGAEQPW